MGAYREQLLKETYGSGRTRLYEYTELHTEEPSAALFTVFKIRFAVCLFLFAGFAWLSLTGNSIGSITSEKVAAAIVEEDFTEEISAGLSKLGLYE
ncbi:MAG: hypothetical protein IKV59_01155 [Lachnospiraceae bacterium]|nr:hypothetical protein [Lachnospiraceae bacterium]